MSAFSAFDLMLTSRFELPLDDLERETTLIPDRGRLALYALPMLPLAVLVLLLIQISIGQATKGLNGLFALAFLALLLGSK